MKFFVICTFLFAHVGLMGQKVMVDSMAILTGMDSMSTKKSTYKHVLTVGGRYYTQPMTNTVTTLGNNLFDLEPTATEFFVKLHNLPKIFLYQQLGTLAGDNYASILGFGVKERIAIPILSKKVFHLKPYMEFGASYFSLKTAQGVQSNTISNVFQSSVITHNFDNFVFTGDVGLDMGFSFYVENTKMTVSLYGGYATNLPAEWRISHSLAFREKINLSTPYYGASIGIALKEEANTCCPK